jgi:hypothetical protein
MDEPAGVVPQRFRIEDNTFRNYHYCADESVHSEALYIGYSDGGLIEGNLFVTPLDSTLSNVNDVLIVTRTGKGYHTPTHN